MHFGHLVLQLAHVTNVFEMPGQNHHGERADAEVLAEIKVCDSASAMLDTENFSADALSFADVFASLSEGNAFGGQEGGEEECEHEQPAWFGREASRTRDYCVVPPFRKQRAKIGQPARERSRGHIPLYRARHPIRGDNHHDLAQGVPKRKQTQKGRSDRERPCDRQRLT